SGTSASTGIAAEGVTTVIYSAEDYAGNQEVSKTSSVRIDRTAPAVSGIPPGECVLWPPNQRMEEVATLIATDTVSGIATEGFQVTATSNEPMTAEDPDVVITPNGPSAFKVFLRADRSSSGGGRIYSIKGTAKDLAGNIKTVGMTCIVPHDQRKP